MPDLLPLRCACGAVQGTLEAPLSGNHIVCYCDDCQAFARWLGRGDVLDRWGGTDILQTAPARLKVHVGAHHLRAIRLTDGGMLRWYTDCCRTPVGNQLATPRSPFVGVITRFVDGDPEHKAAALGPIRGWVQGRYAFGDPPPRVVSNVPIRAILQAMWVLARCMLTGASRPSPFVDGAGRWRREPDVLSPAEREALRAQQPGR